MSAFKTVWQFAGEQGDQFSTVHYREASNLQQATIFQDSVNDLINARLLFLDNQNTLKSIRVSQVDAARVSQTVPVNLPGQSGIGAGAFAGPAQPGAAVIWGLNGTTGGSRKWWIRGYTNANVSTDPVTGLPQVGSVMSANIGRWIFQAGRLGFGILKLLPLPRDPANFVPIASILPMANNPAYSVITMTGNAGSWVKNGRVIISQVSKKDFPGLNGTWQLTDGAGLTFTIRYRLPPYGVVPPIVGVVRLKTYVTPVIPYDSNKCALFSLGTHRTKDSFNNSRGRRSASRLRQSS